MENLETTTMELAEQEKFGDIECSIYRASGNGELFFTREQIGAALEYSDPSKSIDKIHSRHRERIDLFSTTVTLGVVEGGRQVQREMIFYTRKGIMEICRWSRQPKADTFMDWVWEVTDRLMRGDVVLAPGDHADIVPTGDLTAQLDSIAGTLDALSNSVSKAMNNLDAKVSRSMMSLDEKISKVQTASSYSNYYLRCQMRSGYDERWERSQHPHLKANAEFIGMEDRTLLQEIYVEMEHRYGITLDSFVDDYKRTKRISTCSTLSVISFSLTLREMFTAIVDEVLGICGIEIRESTQQSRLLDMAHVAVSRKFEDVTSDG